MEQLSMVILACTLHVTDPNVAVESVGQECKIFQEVFNAELQDSLSPFGCMMQSPKYLVQFMKNHPGMRPMRWKCGYSRPTKKI